MKAGGRQNPKWLSELSGASLKPGTGKRAPPCGGTAADARLRGAEPGCGLAMDTTRNEPGRRGHHHAGQEQSCPGDQHTHVTRGPPRLWLREETQGWPSHRQEPHASPQEDTWSGLVAFGQKHMSCVTVISRSPWRKRMGGLGRSLATFRPWTPPRPPEKGHTHRREVNAVTLGHCQRQRCTDRMWPHPSPRATFCRNRKTRPEIHMGSRGTPKAKTTLRKDEAGASHVLVSNHYQVQQSGSEDIGHEDIGHHWTSGTEERVRK